MCVIIWIWLQVYDVVCSDDEWGSVSIQKTLTLIEEHVQFMIYI